MFLFESSVFPQTGTKRKIKNRRADMSRCDAESHVCSVILSSLHSSVSFFSDLLSGLLMASWQLLRALAVLLLVTGALSNEDNGWSMTVQSEVRGIDGYPVVLPCTFNHPQHSQHSSLQVLWHRGHGQSAVVIYRCTSRPADPSCEPDPNQDQRYRLEGNPREHDLSLRISSATLQDNGRYYCRVEILGREHISFEDKMGTRLRVEAPPRILALLVEGSELLGYTALCQVQGSPLPDVQWFGPDNQLEASPLGPPAQGSPARYRTISELKDVEPGQQYVCSASNPLGKEQATLFVLPPQPLLPVGGAPPHILLLVSVDLGAKLLLLVVMAVWMMPGGALQRLCCWSR